MKLHKLLSDRHFVNMLKTLYDQEHVYKNAHTMNLIELSGKLSAKFSLMHVLECEGAGLVTAEKVEDTFIITLTSKGKRLIENFDSLHKTFYETAEKKEKSIKLDYGLTDTENRILMICYKMQKEQGRPVSLKNLTQELYPTEDPFLKKSLVSGYCSKLVKINLMNKQRKGREVVFNVSDSGLRVLKEEIVERIV